LKLIGWKNIQEIFLPSGKTSGIFYLSPGLERESEGGNLVAEAKRDGKRMEKRSAGGNIGAFRFQSSAAKMKESNGKISRSKSRNLYSGITLCIKKYGI